MQLIIERLLHKYMKELLFFVNLGIISKFGYVTNYFIDDNRHKSNASYAWNITNYCRF